MSAQIVVARREVVMAVWSPFVSGGRETGFPTAVNVAVRYECRTTARGC